MTVAGELVKYANDFSFERLPSEVIHQTKRILIDALGCCIGAYNADPCRIVRDLVLELGGVQESTLIGSGLKTNCANAALVNGIMVRYLDYNDLYVVSAGKWYIGSHPSDSIPGILSVAERVHASGKDLITAIVLSYELSARFCHSACTPPLSKLGWNIDTRGIYIMPLVAGKLLGLSGGEMENAVGISGCHGMILGILDTAAEEYSMTKNVRYPMTSYQGIIAALLAKKGFTGPTTVIEGSEGFNDTVMKGSFDIDRLTALDEYFYTMDTGFKELCAVGAVQGHLSATLDLVNRYSIDPNDVDRVKITAGTRPIEHTGDPAKKYPTNKETADHSSYFLTAVAIVDRKVGPDQYQPSKYNDPRILKLIDKITLKIDPGMDKLPRSGMSEITTKSGNKYESRVDYPKGHPNNPMTDGELEEKFKSMSSRYMNDEQIERLCRTIYNLEALDDVGECMKQLVFEK